MKTLIQFIKESYGILEGGNVFAGKTTSIALENIKPTLEAYFNELKRIFPNKKEIFDEKHFIPLGSVGKKPVSGDIDLGVDSKTLLDQEMSDESIMKWGINIDELNKEVESLSKRARTASPAEIRIKAFLKLLSLYINKKAMNLYCDEKKITPGNIFGLYPQFSKDGKKLDKGVQIDWMIGNLEWLTFSYYSAAYPPESNVKGLHRTQLMLAAFQVANMSFNHVSGVKDKETGKVIAQDPVSALRVLSKKLGFPITKDDAENYYKLHSLLKSRLPKDKYEQLLHVYFRILDSTRTDIPDDMQKDWIRLQPELGLRGKFLPDTSALKSHAISESGSTGAERVKSRQDFAQFLKSYEQIISKFPGFVSMSPSGSYNSDIKKHSFGDIDLIVHIKTNKDKATLKKELAAWLIKKPDTVIVPFSSERYKGHRHLNTGEIVTVRYHDPIVDYSAQIDNIIALDAEEANFKKSFLDFPAEKQGLMIGLAKVATLETPVAELFKMMNIKLPAKLPKDQEYEFNLSSTELSLRHNTYSPGTYEVLDKKVVWSSKKFSDIEKLLHQYDLNTSFDELLDQIKHTLKNPRSAKRVIGLFGSMVSVKSGEVGTPKGQGKLDAIQKVSSILS